MLILLLPQFKKEQRIVGLSQSIPHEWIRMFKKAGRLKVTSSLLESSQNKHKFTEIVTTGLFQSAFPGFLFLPSVMQMFPSFTLHICDFIAETGSHNAQWALFPGETLIQISFKSLSLAFSTDSWDYSELSKSLRVSPEHSSAHHQDVKNSQEGSCSSTWHTLLARKFILCCHREKF